MTMTLIRFILFLVVFYLLARMVKRFFVNRFRKFAESNFEGADTYRYDRSSGSPAEIAEEAEYEVIESHIRDKPGSER
jgi:hypothetical protein